MGRAPARRQRRSRALRRVVHGHQPVPDGGGSRIGLADQGDVPDHFGQRSLRRHGDPGGHPRPRVRRDVHRVVVGVEPHQPGAAAPGGGGAERQPVTAGQRTGQPRADDRGAQPRPRVVPAARAERGERAGRRRVRRQLLGGPQPFARPAGGGQGRHPRVSRRRLERPLRTGRAAQLRGSAEPGGRAAADRRHDGGPGGHPALPVAHGAVAARDHGDGRQHLGTGARVVRHLAVGRAHADVDHDDAAASRRAELRWDVGGRQRVGRCRPRRRRPTTSPPDGVEPLPCRTTTAT